STSAQSQKRVKGSIFLPRVAGLTSEQFRTNDLWASPTGDNPLNLIRMFMTFVNINSNIPAAVQCDVRYTAYVEFFGRNDAIGTDAPVEAGME
ncbi:MAG: hypothetical protein H7836_17290, partial [Magnetococcus sp. YQC-3]